MYNGEANTTSIIPKETPMFQQLTMQYQQLIDEIRENKNGIELALGRMTNPEPSSPCIPESKDGRYNDSHSLESVLRNQINQLESLSIDIRILNNRINNLI